MMGIAALNPSYELAAGRACEMRRDTCAHVPDAERKAEYDRVLDIYLDSDSDSDSDCGLSP